MNDWTPRRIDVIGSHTGGEPTSVVVAGGPDLGGGTMAERLATLRDRYDMLRTTVVGEPRTSNVVVGALLCEPTDPDCAAGVIFFNNVGYLGMCGHGLMGVAVTLLYMKRIEPGTHRIETPVGEVTIEVEASGAVAFEGVSSYRLAADVRIEVEGYGRMTGEVAWGGNWFFLVGDHGQTIALDNVERLSDVAWKIRQTLVNQGITGIDGKKIDGKEIDHIELFGPPDHGDADSKNFVLCPGRAYDRSPCGTGTSAKLACLAADGQLSEGDVWRQEGILGTVFEGSFKIDGEQILPRIKGSAYINSEATLVVDPSDPFQAGIGR